MTKIILTIGGSDPFSGGGIQTDLKTFENHQVFGLSTLTLGIVIESAALDNMVHPIINIKKANRAFTAFFCNVSLPFFSYLKFITFFIFSFLFINYHSFTADAAIPCSK